MTTFAHFGINPSLRPLFRNLVHLSALTTRLSPCRIFGNYAKLE
ncbi:hypothetical protein HMPREF9103_01503 [Lentilactobacillus parafarraginis F0439]|uniref:Uncharacterized protein n=1 Tax=Lentilactobacillus parafarraginis F0439 TaxID=797515 RepID=G9ZP49_9LACO|nr:hypothetical protein HMPREF9103_01503 [Lentilactobacillus parafarraginis F0439]